MQCITIPRLQIRFGAAAIPRTQSLPMPRGAFHPARRQLRIFRVSASCATSIAPLAAAAVYAFVTPVCFTPECAAEANTAFAAAIAIPLFAGLALGAYVLRPPPKQLLDSGRLFEDPKTGTIFEAPAGASPELDKNDQLAFRAISYTPWPVASDSPGKRVRIDVGKVGATEPRTFVFEKTLPGRSEVVCITIPRPLGIIFEFDDARKRAFVAGFVPGGNAEQRFKVAKLNTDRQKDAALEGDVLRALTCTCPVWPTKALFGAVAPERHIVVYGADPGKSKWGSIRTALRRGGFKDGPVTLVLERPSTAVD